MTIDKPPRDYASAIALSPCETYRYALWRIWDASQPWVMFVGLNPSTADELHDDPTARRCIGFATSWGYGGVCITNLFAYRATVPRTLRSAPDPIGADNDRWLQALSEDAGLVIAAWGNHGRFMHRDRAVWPLLKAPHILALTKHQQPSHPLYLRKTLKPIPHAIALSSALQAGDCQPSPERDSGVNGPANLSH